MKGGILSVINENNEIVAWVHVQHHQLRMELTTLKSAFVRQPPLKKSEKSLRVIWRDADN
jgi:hypothetical protein